MNFFEHGDAPAAPGACGEAIGDLRGDLGLFDIAEGFDLPQGDVEAEADGIVGFEGHGDMVANSGEVMLAKFVEDTEWQTARKRIIR